MTTTTAAAPTRAASPNASPARTGSRLRGGWSVVAAKEFADHVLSVRFYVILFMLGAAALIPLYFASEILRSIAPAASGQSAIFLALFVVGPQGAEDLVTVLSFVAIAAPLLGVGFAFDSINGERHEGTLPRLLSQPIYRDDVINGKFAAGLAVIGAGLAAVVLVIAGFGMLRLGIVPAPEEVLRLLAWWLVTILYVGVWLAFGMLLSVAIRRAATSALVGFGTWLFVAIPLFGPFLIGLLASVTSGATTRVEYEAARQALMRLLPSQIYGEASLAILSPRVTSVDASSIFQRLQQLPSLLSFDQSLLLVMPHIVTLFALTIGCFALAYLRFMRQEVRA